MWSRPLRVWRDWKILKADEGKVFPFAGATDSIHSLKYSGELLGSTKTHQSKFCARGILFVIQIHTPAQRKSHGERTTSNDAQLVRGHRMRNGNANCALQSRGCALWFLRSGSVSSRAAWRGDAHFAGRSFFFYYFSSPLSLFSLFLRCHFSQPGGWADPSPGCLCGGSTSLSYNNLRESTRVCPPILLLFMFPLRASFGRECVCSFSRLCSESSSMRVGATLGRPQWSRMMIEVISTHIEEMQTSFRASRDELYFIAGVTFWRLVFVPIDKE